MILIIYRYWREERGVQWRRCSVQEGYNSMTAKQYDCKTAWLQSGMNAKYLLTRAVYQVTWAPSRLLTPYILIHQIL